MSFRIVSYTTVLMFLNAPTVRVVVDVAESGERERCLTLEATDADARAICVMVKNPAWNGAGTEGVDDQIATGEVKLAELRAFVQRKIDAAREAPAEVAARMVAAEEAEARARNAVSAAEAAGAAQRAAEAKLAELNARIAEAERVAPLLIK